MLASIPVFYISVAILLCGALTLSLPSGYTYGPVLLLLPALVYMWLRPYPLLVGEDKLLIGTLAFYFGVGAITNLVHHLPPNSYDNFSRFLLAIPVLLLLLRFPVKPHFFWGGIILGALGAGATAVSDYYIAGEMRAAGHNNAIQFGDIAILFACFLLVGFGWIKQQPKWLIIIAILATISSVLASLLSGARGGWLALPVGLGCFYVANHLHKNRTASYVFWGLIPVVIVMGSLFQQTGVLQVRIAQGVADIEQYVYAGNANTSLGLRIELWQASLSLIVERPLLGWGSIANYLSITGDSADIFQRFNHFHNEFLDATVKRGLLGFVALFALYGIPAVLFYRQLKLCALEVKAQAYAGLVLVSATFVFGLTQSFFSHSSGVMVYAFMLVILWSQVRTQKQ